MPESVPSPIQIGPGPDAGEQDRTWRAPKRVAVTVSAALLSGRPQRLHQRRGDVGPTPAGVRHLLLLAGHGSLCQLSPAARRRGLWLWPSWPAAADAAPLHHAGASGCATRILAILIMRLIIIDGARPGS